MEAFSREDLGAPGKAAPRPRQIAQTIQSIRASGGRKGLEGGNSELNWFLESTIQHRDFHRPVREAYRPRLALQRKESFLSLSTDWMSRQPSPGPSMILTCRWPFEKYSMSPMSDGKSVGVSDSRSLRFSSFLPGVLERVRRAIAGLYFALSPKY